MNDTDKASASALPLHVGLAVLVLALVGWRVWFATQGVPILVGDSLFFLPTGMQHLLYGDLSNPYLSPIQDGGGPYVWHGWLYPYALSVLGRVFSVRTMQGMQAIDCALATLAALIFALMVSRTRGSVWIKVAAVVCACSLLSSGRPEVIAQLLLMVWLATYSGRLDARSDLLTAFILAGIALAQPTVALLGACFLATYRACVLATRDVLVSMLRIGVTSLALTIILTAIFYPWTFGELMRGLIVQANKLARRSDGDFLLVYFLSLSSPLLIVWPALAATAGVLLVRGGGQTHGAGQRPRSMLFYPLLIVALYLVWRTGMRNSYTAYNITVFIPLLIYGLLAASANGLLRPLDLPIRLIVAGMAVLLLAVQVRGFAYMELSLLRGAPATTVAQSVQADLRAGHKVAISLNLAMGDFPTAGNPQVIVMEDSDPKLAGDADVLYLHQASSGKREPAEIPGWTLQTNRFLNSMRIAGIPVANTPSGYSYARYVRAPGGATAAK